MFMQRIVPQNKRPFSHRYDAGVPAFPDQRCVVFVDGMCGACSRMARWIAAHDRRQEFLICPVQSGLGNRVLNHYGIDAKAPDSWLYLEEGNAYTGLDAVIKITARTGGVLRLLSLLSLLPASSRHQIYQWIARNRYRFFGHRDICTIPDEALRSRLLDDDSLPGSRSDCPGSSL
ncbi:hypothetical protein VA7868_03198 [Vibrio aerogenes CECT 7868]|uniref:Thiol-disulfide oxidoreductase DCC n=1 Tax=Vibrio aerogenes CECT 7868 TaxID=1216006 RepID=A0A1M5ZTD4_9VIBR|nr:DUF393 domain-containing protein [Vibrio aerogenes]SHI27462.1 hypothetical protein VA7868_03198 [Vibrio aerogenes CECT 7868]